MIKVEVHKDSFEEFSGTSRKTGEPFHIRRQAIWLDIGEKYPAKTVLRLEKDQAPYAEGVYTLAPGSLEVAGEYDELRVSRSVRLVPLNAQRSAS